MANIEEKVETLIQSTVTNLGYELYDVIYEKEAQDYYLRIFIDKKEGIDLNDCEKVNDAISDMLDEANYMKESYFLEVSSPGIERILRKEKHLEQNLEKEVEIKLYKPMELEEKNRKQQATNKEEIEIKHKNKQGKRKKEEKVTLKEITGILKEFTKDSITIQLENEEFIQISRKDISVMKLKYNWE